MNRYAYLPLALLTTACADQITTPTSEQSTPQQPPPVVATVPNEPTASWMTLTGPQPGCSPASEPVQWTVAINNAPELTRLYAHAFRSPKAGCANTVEELALMTVDGLLHYAVGASGTTRFLFEAGRAQCGRTEVGVIWKKASGEDVMLSWQVVDSGKDCAPPPSCATDPKLCPPPSTCATDPKLCPPPPTCATDPKLCPPPPSCDVTTPPKFTGHVNVTEVNGKVTVVVTYTYQNIQSGRAVLMWRNGSSSHEKQSAPLFRKCVDGAKTESFTWTSTFASHLPSKGAVYWVERQ